MLGRVAKTTLKSKTGRKIAWRAAKAGAKGGTRSAGGAGKFGARVAGSKTGRKFAWRAGKAGARNVGRAGKVAVGTEVGRRAARGSKQSEAPRGGTSNLFRYALVAVVGLVIGAILARLAKEGSEDTPSSFTDTTGPDTDGPAGQRGETWGSGTPTGSERAYSDPSEGPLVGESHDAAAGDVPEQQEEVEQRIRTRIGEDPRTTEMPRVNVEVNDGVAELRGVAPSEEAKDAAGEIAAQVEGVREVRNLITVGG